MIPPFSVEKKRNICIKGYVDKLVKVFFPDCILYLNKKIKGSNCDFKLNILNENIRRYFAIPKFFF